MKKWVHYIERHLMNPSFNPRWKSGIADFVITIKIDSPEWIEE